MQTVRVTVPAAMSDSRMIIVQSAKGPLQVQVPPGLVAGDAFEFMMSVSDSGSAATPEPVSVSATGLRQRFKSPFTARDEAKRDRIDQLVLAASEKVPPQLAQYVQMAAPAIKVLTQFIATVGPLYVQAGLFLYNLGSALPWNLLQALLGLGLCFFGGGYCASIAAVEAFALTGWVTTRAALVDVYEEALLVYAANAEDDKKDDDHDGVSDSSQLTDPKELLQRKMRVAAAAVRDPQKLATAVGGLWSGWLAVQGVLRVQFARTCALAVSIANGIEFWVLRLVVPIATPAVPKEFRHWLPTIVTTATKGCVLFLAWYLQTLVSAFQSAMRGGLLFSRGLLAHLNDTGHKSFLGFSLVADHSYLDEAFGYSVAAVGFYFQWSYGFGMPFPLNIIMLPFDILEWYIRWSISSGPDTAAQ